MRRWIAETEQVLSEHVPAPSEQVRAFFVDLGNLETLHPFQVSVQPGARRRSAEGWPGSPRTSSDVHAEVDVLEA